MTPPVVAPESETYCIVRVADGEVVGASAVDASRAIWDAAANNADIGALWRLFDITPEEARDGIEANGYMVMHITRENTRPRPAAVELSGAMVERAARALWVEYHKDFEDKPDPAQFYDADGFHAKQARAILTAAHRGEPTRVAPCVVDAVQAQIDRLQGNRHDWAHEMAPVWYETTREKADEHAARFGREADELHAALAALTGGGA